MRIHTGVGHTGNESAHFESEKLPQIFIVLRTGFEHLVSGNPLDLEANAVPIEPPRPPK